MQYNHHAIERSKERGFTLLLAALVASIVLALGTAIYSIAIKQLTLSSLGRDSQFAFYAADTMAECALYNDIRLGAFATSTSGGNCSFQVTCNNEPECVQVSSDQSQYQGGSQSYATAGTYTFTVPSGYGQLTVTVRGAGGGGGGGGYYGSQTGRPGTAGSRSSFNVSLWANGGGGGPGGKINGTPQTTGGSAGSASDGSSGGGNTGGGGGAGAGLNPNGTGGQGGTGGYVSGIYTPGTLPSGTQVTVVVGDGGSGGSGGCRLGVCANSGSSGNSGRVDITWTGAAPVWNSSTFTFQMKNNGNCTNVMLTKTNNNNTISTLIHADGTNVPCNLQATDPHSLQRSVELKY